MSILLEVYRRSPRIAVLATLGGALSGLASTGIVALINRAIASDARAELAGAFIGLCAAAFITKLAAELALLRLTQRRVRELRLELSRKLLRNPLEKLQRLGKHRLLANLTDDITQVSHSCEWIPIVVVDSVIVLGCLAYLAWLSVGLFAVLALLLLGTVAAFGLAERRALRALERVRELKDRLFLRFRGLVEGTKELQQNEQRAALFVERLLATDARETERMFIRGMTDYSLVTNLGVTGFYAILGVLLFAVPLELEGQSELLASFCITLLYLMRPIVELIGTVPALRQAGIALDRLRALEVELDPGERREQGVEVFAAGGGVRLRASGLVHHHAGDDDHPFTLGPIDLTLRSGEIVFLVGGNGSGKTTLALLLLGLYEPEAGVITVNGTPVGGDNRAAYRQLFSAVFSDFYLFEELIGAEHGEIATRALQKLRAFQLDRKVRLSDGRLSTLALSSGQRKRLALVGAYLEDRPIYVFDEWAADQDPSFRRVFYTELLPELRARGKAVLAITHDEAYFEHADRVIKLDEGRVQVVVERERSTPHLRPAVSAP